MRNARSGLFFLALAMLGCETRETTRTETVVTVGGELPANANARPVAAATGTMRVAFRDVVTQTPGCFFFSGPEDLGRDDHLGTAATFDGRELAFGPDIRFLSQASGSDLVLLRESLHAFSGSWRVRESITLVPSGAGFVGRYRYDEIDPSTGAPSQCHIDARIELWP